MGCSCSKGQGITELLECPYILKTSDFREKYVFVRILGSGSFGKVRLYKNRQNPSRQYAIKTLLKDPLQPTKFNLYLQEVNTLRQLDHPNIVKYFETFEDDNYIHIVMEYLEGDNLYKLLSRDAKENTLEEKHICMIIQQITKALLFLHKKGLIHRDIKPENILFSKEDDYSTLKLIDFGLAVNVKTNKNKSSAGSPCYMSPETIQGKCCCKSDMWSLGVIMHIMLTGKFPYKGDNSNDLFDKIVYEEFNTKYIDDADCSNHGKDLVKKLLNKDMKMRPSSEEMLYHPWFRKFNSDRKSTLINKQTVNSIRDYTQKTALEKEILFFIAKVSNAEQIKQLKEIFISLDLDNRGTLSMNEIRRGFSKMGIELTESEMKEVWEGLDLHGDGQVNYTEFLAATLSSVEFDKDEELWAAFKFFESVSEDGEKGIIKAEHIINAAKQFQLKINEEDIRNDIEKLEEQGKEINYSVFKELIGHNKK